MIKFTDNLIARSNAWIEVFRLPSNLSMLYTAIVLTGTLCAIYEQRGVIKRTEPLFRVILILTRLLAGLHYNMDRDREEVDDQVLGTAIALIELNTAYTESMLYCMGVQYLRGTVTALEIGNTLRSFITTTRDIRFTTLQNVGQWQLMMSLYPHVTPEQLVATTDRELALDLMNALDQYPNLLGPVPGTYPAVQLRPCTFCRDMETYRGQFKTCSECQHDRYCSWDHFKGGWADHHAKYHQKA